MRGNRVRGNRGDVHKFAGGGEALEPSGIRAPGALVRVFQSFLESFLKNSRTTRFACMGFALNAAGLERFAAQLSPDQWAGQGCWYPLGPRRIQGAWAGLVPGVERQLAQPLRRVCWRHPLGVISLVRCRRGCPTAPVPVAPDR